MANVIIQPTSGLLEFNTGVAGTSGLDTNLSGARFTSNSGELVLTSYSSGNYNRFSIQGTNGMLFSVDDVMTGSIFSVNTVGGNSLIEVFSDGLVRLGPYSKNLLTISGTGVGVGVTPDNNYALRISGKTWLTGLLTATSGAFSSSLTISGVPVSTGGGTAGASFPAYADYGASPDWGTTGKLSFDTTDSMLYIATGSSSGQVLTEWKKTITFVLEDPTDADTAFPISVFPYPITLNRIRAMHSLGSTGVAFQLEKRTGFHTAGTGMMSAALVSSLAAASTTSFSHTYIPANAYLVFCAQSSDTGVDFLVVQIDYTLFRT